MTTTVETRSPQMNCLEERRALCRDIYGGTGAMIKAGRRHLPQHLAESSTSYDQRLKATILSNFVQQAVSKAVGKIFSKAITLRDNVPKAIVDACEDIDRQGRALNPFLMDVATSAFVDGVSYILADFPLTAGITTLAEEEALKLKPYAIHVKAHNVLEILTEQRGGETVITRVRISEEFNRPVPGTWEYEEVEQVRVFYLEGNAVRWELWREIEDDRDQDQFVLVDSGQTTFTRIPLIPIYTNRTGYMVGTPPFQHVAELNLRHWRLTSEQTFTCSMQSFAMLGGSGVNPDSVIEVGPCKKLFSKSPDSKFYYVEPTGKGAEIGRIELKAIESAIETVGAMLRVERAGQVTATAAAIDSEETNASLKAVALGIEDSIEELFQHFARILGLGDDAGGEVVVNTDFGAPRGTDAGLNTLAALNMAGKLSDLRMLAELQYRGELSPDFDHTKNADELTLEADAMPPAVMPPVVIPMVDPFKPAVSGLGSVKPDKTPVKPGAIVPT